MRVENSAARAVFPPAGSPPAGFYFGLSYVTAPAAACAACLSIYNSIDAPLWAVTRRGRCICRQAVVSVPGFVLLGHAFRAPVQQITVTLQHRIIRALNDGCHRATSIVPAPAGGPTLPSLFVVFNVRSRASHTS
jgi:hypothetical protein